MPILPCPDAVGSINNPDDQVVTPPYVPPTSLCVGQWQITGATGQCATNEAALQESYIAESLNISGAPINVFRLLGVHEQGNGSVLSKGSLISSSPYPGYPSTNINTAVDGWRSLQVGSDVINAAFVGIDFGIKSSAGITEYEEPANNWVDVGAISITQSNSPDFFARQVRVDLSDGTLVASTPIFLGAGDGTIQRIESAPDTGRCTVIAVALTSGEFEVLALLTDGTTHALDNAFVDEAYHSPFMSFLISSGANPFQAGDTFTITVDYLWKRVAMFNLVQSPDPQLLNLKQVYKARAVRVVPTLYSGADSWEVLSFDVLDSPPTHIDNVQDTFFNENRDRDYAKVPLQLKTQYTPNDSGLDLSKFGLSMLDQYVFTVSFAAMVMALGRPIVVGDIIELIPEMQYDQNLRPIKKFLEVTDGGWASSGFSPAYKPMVYRFTAQQALPSQETRDIFGTLDTQKYLVSDGLLADIASGQLNTAPLTIAEEIIKSVDDAVPETGSNDIREISGVPSPTPRPPANLKGQPAAVASPNPRSHPNLYIESGLPPNNLPYGEGYVLPQPADSTEGEYYRLYYPAETKIPPRLYRFSQIKNKWIYLETDRRGDYNSFKPSVRAIMQSTQKRNLDDSL